MGRGTLSNAGGCEVVNSDVRVTQNQVHTSESREEVGSKQNVAVGSPPG